MTIEDYTELYRTMQDYIKEYRELNSLLDRLIKTGDRQTDRRTHKFTEFVESWGAYAPKNIKTKIAQFTFKIFL